MKTIINHALVLSVIVGAALVQCKSTTAQEDNNTESVFTVFRLQHVEANDARNTVLDLITPDTARLSIEERSNSVVVIGTKEDVDFVSSLLERLDVPPQRSKQEESTLIKTYPFSNQRALKQGFGLMQTMLAEKTGVRMDMDLASSSLFLQATKKQHELAKNLFEQVVQASESQDLNNVHVSTYLIVDGNQVADQAGKLKKPNNRLQQVLANASKKGLLDIAQPLVASQVSSLVSSAQSSGTENQANRGNGYFENQSSGKWFELRNDGTLTLISKERFSLSSRVKIILKGADSAQHLAEISGDIEMPLNHPVMLSFSTIGGVDSAIIIILTSE